MLPVPPFARFKHLSLSLRDPIRFGHLRSEMWMIQDWICCCATFNCCRHAQRFSVMSGDTPLGMRPLSYRSRLTFSGSASESCKYPNHRWLETSMLLLSMPDIRKTMAQADTMMTISLAWIFQPAIIISEHGVGSPNNLRYIGSATSFLMAPSSENATKHCPLSLTNTPYQARTLTVPTPTSPCHSPIPEQSSTTTILPSLAPSP